MSILDGSPGTTTPGGDRAHSLLVSETDRDQRVGATAWVDEQLSGGAKVFYKARPEVWGGDPHWLLGPGGTPRASRALTTGQLEIMDFVEVVQAAGGTTQGLRELQFDEITRGLGEGWVRVAMSQESPGRPLADEAEIAEFTAQESAYDELARDWPLTTLCQLTLVHENPVATWETAALHSGDIVDHQWSALWHDGRWRVRGELDASVVQRFGAALHGALRRCFQENADPTLHVDASEIEFVDVATAQSLILSAHSAGRRQRIVVHGADEVLRDVVAAVGRPRSLEYADEAGSPR